MKKKKKIRPKKLPRFELDESITKFFPPVSRMGFSTPIPYANQPGPAKTKESKEDSLNKLQTEYYA